MNESLKFGIFARVWLMCLILEILVMVVSNFGTRSCTDSCKREWAWKNHEGFGGCFKRNL